MRDSGIQHLINASGCKDSAAIHPKHTARALLHEARARRGSAFSHVLLRWAGNARRRAAEGAPIPTTPTQQALFP